MFYIDSNIEKVVRAVFYVCLFDFITHFWIYIINT